jgi:hypothetical protein
MTTAEKLRILQIHVQEIKQDCEELSRMSDSPVTFAERRTWKAIGLKLGAALKASK